MVDKVLYTVLRQGGEYTIDHVTLLNRQLKKLHPDATLICIVDYLPKGFYNEGNIYFMPTPDDWPDWWVKMNLFNPLLVTGDRDGNVLYCDLDTVLVGPLDDLWNAEGNVILRDFYRPNGLGSGLMKVGAGYRRKIWSEWNKAPYQHIRDYKAGGDQAFLESLNMPWYRWQDVLPADTVCSFKADIQGSRELPRDCRVVCFHGQPRPWDVVDRLHREWIDNAAV